MVLKFNDKNSVLVENGKVAATVTFDKCIEVSIVDEKTMSFSKPGEYEYKGIDIVSREIVTEGYSACANMTKLTVEGVRVLFLLEALEAKQEDLEQVLEIDILVVRETELDKIDRLAMLYNPQKIVVIPGKLTETEITEILKKSFSTSEIATERQIKPKSEEFSSENFVVSFYILKK